MANYNIEIEYFNGSIYDTLYPLTLTSQISDSLSASIINRTITNATNAIYAIYLGGYTYSQIISNASGFKTY